MKISKEVVDISQLDLQEKEILAEALWVVAKEHIVDWNFMQFKSHYVFCNLHTKITTTPINKVTLYKHDNIITSFVFLQYIKFHDNPIYLSRLYAIVDGRDRGHLTTTSMAVKEWIKFFLTHPLTPAYCIDTVYHPVLYSQIKKLVSRTWEGPDVLNHPELNLIIETYCQIEGIKTDDNFETVNQGDSVRFNEDDLRDFKRLKNKYFDTFFEKTAGKNRGILIAFPLDFPLFFFGTTRFMLIMFKKLPRTIYRGIINAFKRPSH